MKYPPTSNRVQILPKRRQSVGSRVLFLVFATLGTCDIIFKEGGIGMRLGAQGLVTTSAAAVQETMSTRQRLTDSGASVLLIPYLSVCLL
jgi:hypothetical protein